MFENERSLTEDVFSLRNLLRLTELNLQSVGQKLSQSEGHEDSSEYEQQRPDSLTLQDLQTPDVPPSQSGCVCQERPLSGTAERRAVAGSLSPPSTDSRMESFSKRKKGGCVRQENACLSVQDEQLISNLDAMQYERAPSKSQVLLRGPKVGVINSVAVKREHKHIRQLQAELETQAAELKAAELRAECSQEAAAHRDILVATLTEELSMLREELDNKTALCKRAEQQRNHALQNAEQLKEAFNDYKATISIKLKRVMESESKLKESLIECDREKEELEMKCTVLERGKVEQSQTISQLKEEGRQAKSAAAGLQAQLEEARQKALHLEQQLMERGAELRELASLRKELESLQTVNQSQEQRVVQSHREAQQSQAELASLEATLALLHLREGAVGTLCVRPCMFPPVDYSGTTHLLKLKPGEGYQQLLRVLQSVETERAKQNSLVEQLQARLSRTQEEISSLQSSMAQRASHYQSLHMELLDKVSQATDTEKELKRKSARAASLEKQLQEKTSAYSQAALTNTELEKQLLEKTSTLQHYQSLMTKKQREYQQSLEKCKKSQSQEFTEQQHKIKMLQLSLEEAQARVLQMEQELSSLRRERDEAQEAALLLQGSVDQLTQVCELQSSLSACREELNCYLQQMEELKKNYESELQNNGAKVSSLQEKLHEVSLVCQSSSEQNLQLQLSLQQQQTMLTESSAHISELEESQSQLQKQVSSLEMELERARASMQGELVSKDSELQRLKREVNTKISQFSRMDESLQHMASQLNRKSEMVMDLEEKLHRCEADRLNGVQRVQVLEGQLQAAQVELAETLEQLRTLQDVLQRTKSTADERQASVEKLTVQLSDTQRELEERTHEVLDMDNALKERQGELQHRAQLLGQLEVAIREHKQEMEMKVESLQQSLEIRERELTERNMKVRSTHREVRLCGVEKELALKEARWLQLEAGLQSMVTTLEQELELEREQHSKELESLQQSRGQLLKVSEQISSTMLSSQEQLADKLQESQNQLQEAKTQLERTRTELDRTRNQASQLQTQRDQFQTQLLQSKTQLEQSRVLYEQARAQNSQLHAQLEQLSSQLNQTQVQAAQLQTQLQASNKSMETSKESLLIKESEVTRLHAKISSLERAADRQHLYSHTLSLPALHTLTHPPESSHSAHAPSSSPQKLQATLPSSQHSHLTRLLSPTHTRTCSSPPAHNFLQPESLQTADWLQSSSIDSSLDVPPSLKATLREALSKHAWESSTPSVSSFLSVDHSWQGLSATDATATSDLSFNPLTYLADSQEDRSLIMKATSMQEGDEEQTSESRRESVCTLVGQEEEEGVDMSSLTGMLKFVNQTLAMQEDPSLWSSTGLSQSGRSLAPQVTTPAHADTYKD
ncbi:hypothetical protein FQN60_016592 [Etheostoma spectabile]|uniref:Coiled-coil domain-containing protein 18 n=1 Tax=Etheostoma spectabile TaxID=54343 RepID=A0A5J5D4B6_9PERO|nr:hypothetical protein FQN60_016592 [Etheostoma spectabile]